jgi:energy-coupling factor transport system substrate-specific component
MQEEQLKDAENEKQYRIRMAVSAVILFILIPATIYICWNYFSELYYIPSILIMLYTCIPFFMIFRKRKVQARDIVIISVMCAIAVASRAAFIMVPGFKPMTAVIIITAAAFGPEAGFLTGTVSAFMSNFIFGQGPWTPWQMAAYGIAGFLAGILIRRGLLSKKRLPLSIYGAAVVILIVGPLLDTCTVVALPAMGSGDSVLSVYLAGIPLNAIHALSTFITLFFLSRPMLEKLDRIKIKYGMAEDEI